MKVNENIRKIRKEKGMTQKELGKKLGISQSAIGQFESKETNLKIDTITKIANALAVDITSLIDTDELAILDIKEHPEKWGFDKEKLSEERIEQALKKLNTMGKEEAVKRVEELTEIKKYTD